MSASHDDPVTPQQLRAQMERRRNAVAGVITALYSLEFPEAIASIEVALRFIAVAKDADCNQQECLKLVQEDSEASYLDRLEKLASLTTLTPQ